MYVCALSGQEVTQLVEMPEVAFTGDTSSGFLTQPGSADALRARLLIMELTFLDDEVTIEHAQVRHASLSIPCLAFHSALVFSGVHPGVDTFACKRPGPAGTAGLVYLTMMT